METKQVIVIRKDLGMRTGKMVAQGAHASMAVITKYFVKDTYVWGFGPTEEMKHWFDHSFTKICVYVNSEEELKEIYKRAEQKFLPCAIIQDNGTTEFHGVRTYTAVAIGPAEVSKIDEITGKLPLL
jgi:PTH2 family peptidyl-tRNA hydrolase